MNAPSTWPMSTAGSSDTPQSNSTWLLSTCTSPVRQSTSTCEHAAPHVKYSNVEDRSAPAGGANHPVVASPMPLPAAAATISFHSLPGMALRIGASRWLSSWHARMAACAEFSLVLDPPVAVLLGTLSVLVAHTITWSRGTPSVNATACATLVLMPCPISHPPCVTCTVPSPANTTTLAAECSPPQAMPYLHGVMLTPRLRQRFLLLKSAQSACSAASPALSLSCDHTVASDEYLMGCPNGVVCPTCTKLASRTCEGGTPSSRAMRSMTHSIAKMLCTAPGARMLVVVGVLVRHMVMVPA
mmetsp:Transcript_24962/g.80408  ORF Transcript_24962/g.80408 Transcript_24962/m.80408 type:complete len:300 (+) Transcript_24962:459-1358(+)